MCFAPGASSEVNRFISVSTEHFQSDIYAYPFSSQLSTHLIQYYKAKNVVRVAKRPITKISAVPDEYYQKIEMLSKGQIYFHINRGVSNLAIRYNIHRSQGTQ